MRVATSYKAEDGTPLQIFLGEHNFEFNDVFVEAEGVPLLFNPVSSEYSLPHKTALMLTYFTDKAKDADVTGIKLAPKKLGDKRYAFCDDLNFLYSQIDYEFIPGLIRPWDDGFLTPVFFNIGVLNKYSQDPKYTLDLFSEAYGTIRADEWLISFGINRNKKVIMWLGDIDSLPKTEQHYLRSENLESDHDIHSEFYDAQIDVQPSDRSAQNEAIYRRNKLNKLYAEKFSVPLYVLDGEISVVLTNLARPVFWEERHIAPAVESLNRIFVESLSTSNIKSQIAKLSPESNVKSIQGLKSFQLLLQIVGNADSAVSMMLPFFVLYDLRIYCSHLMSEDKRSSTLQSIKDRLGLSADTDFESIYDSLVRNLSKSLAQIADLVER